MMSKLRWARYLPVKLHRVLPIVLVVGAHGLCKYLGWSLSAPFFIALVVLGVLVGVVLQLAKRAADDEEPRSDRPELEARHERGGAGDQQRDQRRPT